MLPDWFAMTSLKNKLQQLVGLALIQWHLVFISNGNSYKIDDDIFQKRFYSMYRIFL